MMLGQQSYGTASCMLKYSSALPWDLRDNVRELCKLTANTKGKGHGTKLLEHICQEADKYSKILILIPDNEKLVRFYERFGFELMQTEPEMLMVRNPAVIARTPVEGKVNGRSRRL